MEEDETFEEENDATEKDTPTDEEEEEEAFTKGYTEDDEAEECAECGITLRHKKKVIKAIEAEEYVFCSEDCAKDFEDSLAKTEE